MNDATGKYTDRLNEFDTFIHIEQGYASLMRHLREEHGALSFFVGGDNIISVTPGPHEAEYRDAISHVRDGRRGAESRRRTRADGSDGRDGCQARTRTCRATGEAVTIETETSE